MMNGNQSFISSSWSRQEDKLFEQGLVLFPEETPDRWEKIAEHVPGKTCEDVRERYDDLVRDVGEIDSGRVELPSYQDSVGLALDLGWNSSSSIAGEAGTRHEVGFESNPKGKERDSERRRGVPWTEEEHRLFLVGLQRYGKGDWRSISRNAVVSRTPTQVASHAQKYFLRLNSARKEKKRSSIHDVTTNSLQEAADDPNWIGLMDQSSMVVDPFASPSEPFQEQNICPSTTAYQAFGYHM